MIKSESPLTTFTRKLKKHNAFNDAPNKSLIYLIYFKLLLSEPFRLFEKRKYKDTVDNFGPEKHPVFIIGHWRSGTSFTHFLLSKAPGFFYQTKYQNFFSDNFLTTEEFFKPVLSKIMNFFRPVKNWESNISKTMDLDTPSESDTALISGVSEFTYHWAHLFPKAYREYFNKYLFLEDLSSEELREWKYTMRTLLNKVYLNNKSGRLLIKNPGDTARIKNILDIYPNAKFIFIHRDPYEVFYSNLKLWSHVLNTVSLQKITESEKRDLILDVYKKLHQKYFEQKKLLNPDQLIEISHKNITESPQETLKDIYEKLHLPGYEQALPYFREYIDDSSTWKKSRYKIRDEDIRLINEHWGFAFDTWKYPRLHPEQEKVENVS